MQLARTNSDKKGWSVGHWNSNLAISVGYANEGIDEPHLHQRITEVYLVVSGTAVIRVEQSDVHLTGGDILVVEPGEAHTFTSSSPDYFHYVLHVPGLPADAIQADKQIVPRERLGL